MSSKELEMKAREHDMSDASQEVIVEAAVTGYKKIETGVVEGYKKMESGIVEGFQKVTDKCVEVLFAKEGETVEDAKQRLSGVKKEGNDND